MNAIVHRSAKPIFVDVDRETLCIDIDDLEKKLQKKQRQFIWYIMEEIVVMLKNY